TAVALVSGFYGGWVDKISQRFVDLWIAMPTLIILVTLIGILGPSIRTMIVLTAIVNTPSSIRLMRSMVVSVREEPYLDAARSLGATDLRLMLRHVLPNIFHIVLFSATVSLGSMVLIVASLGFLGYGLPPPQPDLGGMFSGAGLTYMRENPWMAI